MDVQSVREFLLGKFQQLQQFPGIEWFHDVWNTIEERYDLNTMLIGLAALVSVRQLTHVGARLIHSSRKRTHDEALNVNLAQEQEAGDIEQEESARTRVRLTAEDEEEGESASTSEELSDSSSVEENKEEHEEDVVETPEDEVQVSYKDQAEEQRAYFKTLGADIADERSDKTVDDVKDQAEG